MRGWRNFMGILFALLMFALVSFAPVALLGQDSTGVDPPGIEEPANTLEYFYTLAGVVALTALIAGYIRNVKPDWNKIVVHTVTALSLGIIGEIFKIGIFDVAVWWHGLLYAIGAGAVASGIVSIEVIKALLALIKIEPEKKKGSN